ncbi:hypothetical protein K458DRAFT_38031 [Lentithecium fluviatile CBS 122367]|uniref:Uncharacterized protein n=1 Tax=Lentithecium fluviatile CBS 122367 TaxID=1168545 RepID=A0A6G1J1W7_9PLEO|nr:hypothetical protein K458DRAFT_38031 [Lentithecium fluviatile CBS 122367]
MSIAHPLIPKLLDWNLKLRHPDHAVHHYFHLSTTILTFHPCGTAIGLILFVFGAFWRLCQ